MRFLQWTMVGIAIASLSLGTFNGAAEPEPAFLERPETHKTIDGHSTMTVEPREIVFPHASVANRIKNSHHLEAVFEGTDIDVPLTPRLFHDPDALNESESRLPWTPRVDVYEFRNKTLTVSTLVLDNLVYVAAFSDDWTLLMEPSGRDRGSLIQVNTDGLGIAQTQAPDCQGLYYSRDAAVEMDPLFVSQSPGTPPSSYTNRGYGIMNAVNALYMREVCIELRVYSIYTSASDGRSYNTNDCEDLLESFRGYGETHNNVNKGRDFNFMLTGRDMGDCLGIAYVGQCCYGETSWAYGLYASIYSSATSWYNLLTAAHEIGHLFAGTHEKAIRRGETVDMCPDGGEVKCTIMTDWFVNAQETDRFTPANREAMMGHAASHGSGSGRICQNEPCPPQELYSVQSSIEARWLIQ